MKYIKNGKLVLNGTIRECDLQDKINKALEIIVEKLVDIHILLESKTCEQYNNHTHWLGCKGNLNENEYDLLKEILQ